MLRPVQRSFIQTVKIYWSSNHCSLENKTVWMTLYSAPPGQNARPYRKSTKPTCAGRQSLNLNPYSAPPEQKTCLYRKSTKLMCVGRQPLNPHAERERRAGTGGVATLRCRRAAHSLRGPTASVAPPVGATAPSRTRPHPASPRPPRPLRGAGASVLSLRAPSPRPLLLLARVRSAGGGARQERGRRRPRRRERAEARRGRASPPALARLLRAPQIARGGALAEARC